MFGADKLEEDTSCVGAVHLPPPPGDRHTATVDPRAEDDHGGTAVPDPADVSDAGSSDSSDGGSTSSSGVEIIEPPTERLQGGTQPACRVGTGVGEEPGRGNAADPVHRVADASVKPPAPPSGLCLWVSPVLSKGRGRLARRWEWRVSQRGHPPHPSAVLCAPAPSKLRPGLNVGVLGPVRRRSMRPRQRRPGGASRAARGAATEPQLYVPFLSTTPDSDLRQGTARVPGHDRSAITSKQAAPSGEADCLHGHCAQRQPSPGVASTDDAADGSVPLVPPEPPPLFPRFMAALAPHVEWFAKRLRCSQQLLLKRIHLLVTRLFATAEDWRLEGAMGTWVDALGELEEWVWDSLLHLTTSPIPVLMRTDPSLAAKGLGRLGAYEIPAELWHRVVPPDFVDRAMQYNVETDPEGGAGKIGPGVEPILETLKEARVLQPDASPPSVFPFIIPKSSAKVSFILSCVGMNEFKGKPPGFDLPSWELVARFLAGAPPDVRYYATHVDLSNAFCPLCCPRMRAVLFVFVQRGGGGDRLQPG